MIFFFLDGLHLVSWNVTLSKVGLFIYLTMLLGEMLKVCLEHLIRFNLSSKILQIQTNNCLNL